MKRIFALLLLAAMMLPLVACGADGTTTAPETELPVEKIKLAPLTDDAASLFRVVMPLGWKDTMVHDALRDLQDFYAREVGVDLTLSYDTSVEGAREIIVGQTERDESKESTESLEPRDWCVVRVGDDIVINGGTLYSTCLAIDAFVAEIVEIEGELLVPEELDRDYIYARDNTEDVYGTLDEKLAQFGDPSGRLMVTSHRAENINNPENSRSAILAAIGLGADILEIDLKTTKDGRFVLMHDETLTRTTDVAKFAGKNGLPTSHNVSDWTFEQLGNLTLLGSQFGEPIVTIEEALILARGKIILDFDKCTSDADRMAVYRIAVKLRAVDSVMYQGGNLSHGVMKTIYEETGIALPYLKGSGTLSDALSYMRTTYKDVEYAKQAIQITTSMPNAVLAAQINDKCRLWMNTLGWSNDPTGPKVHADDANSWKILFDNGISIIQSDQPYNLLSYIKSRESGSGVTWKISFSRPPVYENAKAIVTFKNERKGELYYTIDGSDPTTDSLRPSESNNNFTISESCKVKVLFVEPNGDEYCFDFDVMLGSPEFYEMMENYK